MLTPIAVVIQKISDTAWERRFETQIKDPLRMVLGQPTSAQEIARGLKQGFNQYKYDAILADLEAMYEEISAVQQKTVEEKMLDVYIRNGKNT